MKSENILKVIDTFKKVLPLATRKNHLDMGETFIKQKDLGHKCGTVHCHAGWYGVAKFDLSKEPVVTYLKGADAIAQDLGFKRTKNGTPRYGLSDWAGQNPNIWGNPFGDRIFSHEIAFMNFEKRPQGAETLQHIIDHWQEVYERVKTQELLNNPPVAELINAAFTEIFSEEATEIEEQQFKNIEYAIRG